ncbi:MAG: ABC transporter ATP-binding protein [Chlamydiota bacterium]
MSLLEAKNLYKSFKKNTVLQGISLSLEEGQSLAITGCSGEGKTTLLHILAGLDFPDKGTLTIAGNSVQKRPLLIRRQFIGFIFQSYQLLDDFSLLENVLMPFFITRHCPYSEAKKRAEELLDFVQLLDKKEEKAGLLSGGEKQRAAIARALINNPKILFADEPTGSLDQINSEKTHQLLFAGVKEFKKTLVLATHNPALASLCQEKRLLHEGLLR